MAMEYKEQFKYASTIKERTADASAFVESMNLLRDVHQQLPIDERGMPTLVTDPAAARHRLLLAACQACRAYYLCSTAPVADCDYGEALQAYMEVFGAPWAAAANTWSASGGTSAVGTADDGGCELGSVLFLFTTGRGPQVYEAAQRALQAAAMLEDPTCHTAVGAQLMELVGSQPKPRTGGRPPLLTTQQLQAACCRHAAEVVYAAATLQRRPAMRPAGFTPLKPEQLAEVLAGQEQCAKQLLLRLEPEAPLSHVVAAMALRSRGQEATADAELAAHYLTAVQLAQAAGRDFLQVKAAADALGAAFLSCSRRGDAASAARLEAALTAFEQAEPVLRRSRKYLPEAWTRQMAEALSFAGQQVAPSRSLVQFARQEAGSGSRSSSNSVARLEAAAAAPNAAALDKSQGTLVPGSQENADPASKCDGCGQASAHLQRCARCKVAQYCSRECQAASWSKHKRTCKAGFAVKARSLTRPGASRITAAPRRRPSPRHMYWLVSLPHGGRAEHSWSQLQEATTYANDYSSNFKFALPESFRVGTLDSLLALSDDLAKVNQAVEGTVNKVRRQLVELQSGMSPEDRADVWVEGQTPEGYLQRFAWNEAKYPSRRPLKEIVSAIMDNVQKLDDDLKVKVTEFSQLRSLLQAAARKQGGSLAVRDLSSLVPPTQLVDTENLTTLLVVVSKQARGEWLSQYESLSEYVVPRSSSVVAEDQDYQAFTVVLFRRVVDNFKTAARGKGFQVKDVKIDVEAARKNEDDLARTKADADQRRTALEQWCITSYGEAFSSWIHVCAVRLFVESILRYGLPPQFLAALMRPNPKHTTKLRKLMAHSFSYNGGDHFSAEGAGEDMFPYVSFTLNIEG